MSIFATLDCSISCTARSRPRAFSMLTTRTLDTNDSSIRPPHFKSYTSRTRHPQRPSPQRWEQIFIQALVRAGQCTGHSQRHVFNFSSSPRQRARRDSCNSSVTSLLVSKPFSTKTNTRRPAEATGHNVSRDELKGLVDFYSASTEDDSNVTSMQYNNDGYRNPLRHSPPSKDDLAATEHTVRKLELLLTDEECPHDIIWEAYQTLPHPRASHIPDRTLGDLLHHLSVVEHKTEPLMLRYLSLIDDLRAIDKPIKASHWTSAISFAGRCLRKISSSQVESALQLWRNMENDAGVKGTNITFNVLFDLATKAGKFVLAEMILKEMETRNLELNRHFRTGLIYHYGLRRDGNGVRRAYRELVDAGELVDSAVITCVIASLLKCGEAVAAEQVFERAKRLHLQKMHEYSANTSTNTSSPEDAPSTYPKPDAMTDPGAPETPIPPPLPPPHWRSRRNLGQALDRAARTLRTDPIARDKVQNSVPLAPSLKTYRALIYYHAVTAGDIDRACELLDEVGEFGVQVHGGLFLSIFKGFSMHGGVAYTGWTRRRLEGVWMRFEGLVREGGDGGVDDVSGKGGLEGSRMRFEKEGREEPTAYMSRAAVEYVLRAFGKCAGYERTVEVWEGVSAGFAAGIGEADVAYLEEVLARLFPDEYQPAGRREEGGEGEDGLHGDAPG